MFFRLFVLLFLGVVSGQSFFNRTLGQDASSNSIRALGMGNTSALTSVGVTSTLSNPSLIGKSQSKFELMLNYAGISVFERRSIVLKDFFGDFLAEGDYVNSSYISSSLTGGMSYTFLAGNFNVGIGINYGELMTFDTQYKEEVRGGMDCPEGIPCTRDILAGYHHIKSDGQIDIFSIGASLGMKLPIGDLSIGLSKHKTSPADISFFSGTDTLNYNVDNLSSIPKQNIETSIDSESFISLGVAVQIKNQLMIAISKETELILSPENRGNFGVYNESSGLIDYFMDCSDFYCNDSLSTQEPVQLSQPIIRPQKTSFGVSYKPVNVIPMMVSLQIDNHEYSKPSLISKNQYSTYPNDIQSSVPVPIEPLQPDIKLRSFNAVKVGIEYTTDSQTILRTGIQYCESPLPGFSPHSTFTYGFGKNYQSIQIDAGGYYKMIEYSYPDVFRVDGEYRQNYDTVIESRTGFSIGIKYSF